MKTPREILLQRHESANDRLDDVRKRALATAFPPTKTIESRPSMTVGFWAQFSAFLQFRAQTGMAFGAVWILIFGLKLATHDETDVAAAKSSVSREVMAEVRQQKQFFAELAGLREPRDAERPKSALPRPRSERHSENPRA